MVRFNQFVRGVIWATVLVIAPGVAPGQESKPVERPRPELPTPVSADKLTRTEIIINPNGTMQTVEKQPGQPLAVSQQSRIKPEQDPRQGVNIRPGRTIPSVTLDSVPQVLLVLGGFVVVCYIAARILVWTIARPDSSDSGVK